MVKNVNEDISLTGFRESDVDALVEYLNEPEIYKWTLRIPYPYTKSDAENWIAITGRGVKDNGCITSFAIRKNMVGGSEKLIGSIGFVGLKFENGAIVDRIHRAEVGFWIARPFWNQGICSSVVKRACEQAFRDWKLFKITAEVFQGNIASERVLTKCGFKIEGELAAHYRKDGRLIDVRAFALFSESQEQIARSAESKVLP